MRILATQLDHPNIVAFYGASLEAEPSFFAMEFADHGNLRHKLLEGRIETSEAAKIFDAVCRGVSAAHQAGVVHRDLKPENVLQVGLDLWKVSDFGLCVEMDRETVTLTRTNQSLGTLPYMAPEQLQNAKNVDARADVYSLGVILYELLTGNFPPVYLEEVEDRFRAVVRKAILRQALDRFQTVEELRHAAACAFAV